MTIFLTEAGLYKLVLGSKQKDAIKFQEWITDDVLPNLRKKGSYIMKKEMMDIMKQLIEKNKKKKEIIKRLSNKLNETTFKKGEQIYVIKVDTYGEPLYKIGKSSNMNNRSSTYKTGRHKLNIVYNIECHNSKLVEKILKYKLKSYRYEKNKELFSGSLKMITKTIKKTINELEKGKQLDPTEKLLSESDSEINEK